MSVLIGLSPFIVFFVLMRLVSPVAGLVASAVSPPAASAHSPPMNSRVRVAAVAMG